MEDLLATLSMDSLAALSKVKIRWDTCVQNIKIIYVSCIYEHKPKPKFSLNSILLADNQSAVFDWCKVSLNKHVECQI